MLCRDHVDNVLFEASVETIDDEREVIRECRKYGPGTWVDYVLDEV